MKRAGFSTVLHVLAILFCFTILLEVGYIKDLMEKHEATQRLVCRLLEEVKVLQNSRVTVQEKAKSLSILPRESFLSKEEFMSFEKKIQSSEKYFFNLNNTKYTTNVAYTPAKISEGSKENEENIRDLNEILVVNNNTAAIIISPTFNNCNSLATIHSNNEAVSKTQKNQKAPIAREEDEEEEDAITHEGKINKNDMNSKDVEEKYQQQPQRYSTNNEIGERSVGGGSKGSGSGKSSRVRNYLRKYKDRWLAVGLQKHNNEGYDPKSTMTAINEFYVSQDLATMKATTATTIRITENSNKTSSLIEIVKKMYGIDRDDVGYDVADASYEDIDFGPSSDESRAAAEATEIYCNCNIHTLSTSTHDNIAGNDGQSQLLPKIEHLKPLAQQQEQNCRVSENNVQQLLRSKQMEYKIAALVDRHLAGIYPIFTNTTRATLIREARDVIMNIYLGCIKSFEENFLCKFTEIVVILRQRHRLGEAIIWCQGWPLVTPSGEVILHLGGIDDDQVKPAEIYLCVKKVETSKEPQLYAVWRTPAGQSLSDTLATITARNTATTAAVTLQSGSTLKSCQLDYQDPTLYLSTLALEMLNDDLPQLLQNLLLGVENSLERLSLNQLPQILFNDGSSVCGSNSAVTTIPVTATTLKDGKKNHHNGAVNGMLQLSNSPKCALRRSEIITKNKLHNSKYMLRRSTNRQDSMNSTSSGHSSASGLSTASSDSDSNAKAHLNINNNRNIRNSNSSNNNDNNNHNIITTPSSKTTTTKTTTSLQQTKTQTNELKSPALPRFCLGNSFPHIDSDEENTEDTRNSLNDDQLESEIVPLNLITDIPEKLLLSGIYLPGTCDLKGNPLVTIDAESVLTAGLNCYEVATLLLYYSTITEGYHIIGKTISNAAQRSQPESTATLPIPPAPQPSLHQLRTTTTTTPQYEEKSTTTTTTQLSSKAIVTTSPKATCTSLIDKNNINCMHQQPQQQTEQQPKNQLLEATFTILIVIGKSQHLCVIDLISQSLRLLTRYIKYCELLVICLDTNLVPTLNKNENCDVNAAFGSCGLSNEENSTTTDSNGNHCNNKDSKTHIIKFIGIDEITTSVAPSQTPRAGLGGLHHHDARKWRDFLLHYEPFYNQCTSVAYRLVAALNDIRYADRQSLPTRRQLYAQHRALSRALMDSELHYLRKHGTVTMLRLQELAKSINNGNGHNGSGNSICTESGIASSGYSGCLKTTTNNGSNSSSLYNRNRIMGSGISSYSFNYQSNQNHIQSQISHNISTTKLSTSSQTTNTTTTNPVIKSSIYASSSQSSTTTAVSSRISTNYTNSSSSLFIHNSNNNNDAPTCTIGNTDVAVRLQKVTLLFNEIDRAAKRLEQLTEQRREHLRELTRQHELEDKINEVTSWITSDGSESLQRFINIELDFETPMKEIEHEFEKYYFISMKHLAKGRDLHLAAACMESLKESSSHLKKALDSFAEKLEITRERIEGATRLYHLIHVHMLEDNLQQEMKLLAGRYGIKGLLEKYLEKENERLKPKLDSLDMHFNHNTLPKSQTQMVTSMPETNKIRAISHKSCYGAGSFESVTCHCWRASRNLYEMDETLDNDDEEAHSKIADSGLGECQRCEENPKFSRVCSCQSLNEESENFYEKNDELDDECFEQPSKHYINVHSPWEANKHLQCYGSTFELPKLEELSYLDPKIQKTLLLIMREMIGTERDYVRSLYYVIENYIDELLRDDIPQSLRGQRNVIFGNIEKIFEFHNNHFLAELERYEHNPLKVGAAFLHMESQFYLYALYNKNKPKSDTLMSEYGTTFFKSKQVELTDKMDLGSYLLKPVQRMGKYALLLQQLVKACSTVQGSALQEIAADVEELQKAEKMVKFQLRHGNDLLAMDSLKDCDVNVKEQGRLLRQNEFLVWQGRGGKKTLRQIFLFEELVLFSKARRFPDQKNLDIYIYKNSIKTSDIGLTAHIGDSPTKFEIWFRKRKPEDTFTLQCMSEDIKNAWTEEISKLLWQQAKRNREIRLAEMSSMGIGSKPCLNIRPSNNQINDRSITINQLGKVPKLRHSFVGLHTNQIKTSRRPNSLLSESSLCSSTSRSSLSKSSTSSSSSSAHHHNNLYSQQSHCQQMQQHHPNQALELINECQTAVLENGSNFCSRSPQLLTNTMSSGFSSHSSSGGGTISSRQRSTTIVSQLSMESGIISDIFITPDQDVKTTWPSHSTDVMASPTTSGQKYIYKCHSSNTLGKKPQKTHNHHLQHHQYKELKSEEIVENLN